MASRYLYSLEIHNNYLGVSKIVKGMTRYEVQLKASDQLKKWDEREKKERAKEAINDLKEQAEFDTSAAQELIRAYKNILNATLQVNDKLDWEVLKDKTPFGKVYPSISKTRTEMQVPVENKFAELIFKSRKRARLAKEEQAHAKFSEELDVYHLEKAEFEKAQNEQNESIVQLKFEFENGHGEAIEKYVHIVLERSIYPDGFHKEYDIVFEPISGTIIINYNLPSKESMPRIIEHKFVASRKEISSVEMKQKEFDLFYEDVLYQVCLRTIHEVFESVYIDQIMSVVFNGWVEGVDPRTGNDFRSCILSCQASRAEFLSYNLSRVEPKECYRNLKGMVAGPLAQLAPVRPIYNVDRNDKRFVESKEVLNGIDSTTNLAAMDWADFEHLVRELFAKIFSKDGAEVKVTQASRDGGVDAVAFDPDPIRGGKFVIQAKRYTNVVPVSAVRDLYGTMVSEGASKGILVTTSYYGNDSREFAKDKPLTLIDGSNLVYMFQEHGHHVTIDLKK
ncbi:restriction endonuclease [Cohnella nanjingensis]|uniref:Restriction endonuclease n=1 Tax=Cohnella nanjingensis TaxID=1387779 RepID=A0A7X0RRE1_9BACL|nr:restriction endonuclease [Cohnella nanjingensis]MBB6672273.1 restriction endonuclease [Cohnella nanjingensis]